MRDQSKTYEDAIAKAVATSDAEWLARELRERLRINVGLIAENVVLKRQLASGSGSSNPTPAPTP